MNQDIWLLSTGARQAALRKIKTISECLVEKFINAAKVQSNSYAIKKKDGFFLMVHGCKSREFERERVRVDQ